MKIIQFAKTDGKMIASIGEAQESGNVQQVSIPHISPLNRRWVRQFQLNQEFLFLKKYQCPTVAFRLDDLVALLLMAEPKISWPPIFTRLPVSATIKGGESASLSVETAIGELPTTYQWQTTDDAKTGTWSNILEANSTTLSVEKEGFYRCVASNEAGNTGTEPVRAIVKEEPPAPVIAETANPVNPPFAESAKT